MQSFWKGFWASLRAKNACKKLCTVWNYTIIEDKKNLFILYLFGVSIFLKKIDTPKLRIFCLDLYQLLLITSAMSLPGALLSAQPFTPSWLTLANFLNVMAATLSVSSLRAAWRPITSL